MNQDAHPAEARIAQDWAREFFALDWNGKDGEGNLADFLERKVSALTAFALLKRNGTVSPSEGEREALVLIMGEHHLRCTDPEVCYLDTGDPATWLGCNGHIALAILGAGFSRAAGSASISDESVSAAQRVLAERYGYPLSAAAVMDALLAAQGAGSASSALPEGVTLEVVAEAIKACAVAAHRLGAIGDALDRAFEAAATEEAPDAR